MRRFPPFILKRDRFGFVVDGPDRLREEIAMQVRRRFEAELSKATGYWQKVAIRLKIRKEVSEQMKHMPSPYSLWNSV